MFSLQTIFGKGDKFYGLLEASAAAARQSAVFCSTGPPTNSDCGSLTWSPHAGNTS